MSDNNNLNNNDELNNENESYFGFENDVEKDIKSKEVEDKQKNIQVNKKSSKKTLAMIAGGLVCAVLGGVVGGVSASYFNGASGTQKTTIINESPQFAKAEGALTVPQVVQKVAPAVVGVSTKTVVRNFFNSTEQEGLGSGFIISEEGLILTNYHVIQGASEVKAILNDGTEVNAKVVNYDATQDIAVLDIIDDIKVPGIAELGDSKSLLSGEEVIAIGNPLGKEFSETVTKGIVSSANRMISTDGVNTLQYIQTDAAINPGNSGGPLINSKGQVIGINTAKKVGEGIEGIGLSIPINTVKDRLGALSKPILLLGISARDVNAETAKVNGLEEGVYIVGVGEFSPAEKAGLRIGDLIIKFGGERVKTTEELNTIKQKYNEGDSVKVTILRDGKEMNVEVKLTATGQ